GRAGVSAPWAHREQKTAPTALGGTRYFQKSEDRGMNQPSLAKACRVASCSGLPGLRVRSASGTTINFGIRGRGGFARDTSWRQGRGYEGPLEGAPTAQLAPAEKAKGTNRPPRTSPITGAAWGRDDRYLEFHFSISRWIKSRSGPVVCLRAVCRCSS